jgi:hypothetical protein
MIARFAALCLILAAVFSAPSGAEDANAAHPSKTPELEGVWVLDMEGESISMVVYQSGTEIAGACTGEYPEPWNAVMTGSVSGKDVDLFVLSIHDGVGVMIEICGEENDGGIWGSFIQTDSLGGQTSGNLTGFKTSPDTSAYEPAPLTVKAPPSDQLMESATPLEAAGGGVEDKRGGSVGMPAQRESETDNRRFVDVTTQAERVFYLGWAWNPD